MRTDGTPQIPTPVVGPGSPCGEKSTLSLSDFLTCRSQRDWGLGVRSRASVQYRLYGEDRAQVLPGVKVRTLREEGSPTPEQRGPWWSPGRMTMCRIS